MNQGHFKSKEGIFYLHHYLQWSFPYSSPVHRSRRVPSVPTKDLLHNRDLLPVPEGPGDETVVT